ncbi:hypothetical protein [Massilia sp. TN1-12]|uniref:hypothetical protein n=1 Tax=Massilia paldalensis TaxID=3377675 RepID=UPI00384B9208
MSNAVDVDKQRVISLEDFADLLEESKVESVLDLGGTILHRVIHPVMGALVLINTTGLNALVTL